MRVSITTQLWDVDTSTVQQNDVNYNYAAYNNRISHSLPMSPKK